MNQAEARRRAKELGGIAVSAHPKFDAAGAPAGWRLGGWPNQKGETWIVVSPDQQRVLDDRQTPGDELPDRRLNPGEKGDD